MLDTNIIYYRYMPPKDLKKTSEILKNRIKACKNLLPNNWRQQIVNIAPEYDSLKGARLMDNVFKLRSSDLRLTELIEQIVRSLPVDGNETALLNNHETFPIDGHPIVPYNGYEPFPIDENKITEANKGEDTK
jgi:hypothetical protein